MRGRDALPGRVRAKFKTIADVSGEVGFSAGEPTEIDCGCGAVFACGRNCGETLRRAGRKPAARAYDALIAATAISTGLPLYTTDPDGYTGIEGLTVVSIPHPDREEPAA